MSTLKYIVKKKNDVCLEGWTLVYGQRIAEAHTTRGMRLLDLLRRFYDLTPETDM